MGRDNGRNNRGLRWRCSNDRRPKPTRPSLCHHLKKAIRIDRWVEAEALLTGLAEGQIIRADKAWDAEWARDAEWLRRQIEARGAAPDIPNRAGKKQKACFCKSLDKERNRVERFFNKIKYFRRIATRYDKPGSTYLAMVKLAAIRIWLRLNEPAA